MTCITRDDVAQNLKFFRLSTEALAIDETDCGPDEASDSDDAKDDSDVILSLDDVEICQETKSSTASGRGSSKRLRTRSLRGMRRLLVSSVVLAEHSTFFRNLLTSSMKDATRETELRVTLSSEGEADQFVVLVYLMYSGKLGKRTSQDVLELLILADRFGMQPAIDMFSDTLGCRRLSLSFALQCIEQLPESLAQGSGCALVDNAYRNVNLHFQVRCTFCHSQYLVDAGRASFLQLSSSF